MLKCWLLGDAKWDSLRKGRLLQCLFPGPARKETDHVLLIGTRTNTGVQYTSARIQAHTGGCTDQHSGSTTGLIPFPFLAAQGGLIVTPLMCAHTCITWFPNCLSCLVAVLAWYLLVLTARTRSTQAPGPGG